MNSALLTLIVVFLLLCGVKIFALVRSRTANKNTDVLRDALKALKIVVGGITYSGNASEIVYKYGVNWIHGNKVCEVKYLCKTNKDNWFLLNMTVQNGVIEKRVVEPVNEYYVEYVLSREITLYKKYIGELEQA